jgi:hypothetical protein
MGSWHNDGQYSERIVEPSNITKYFQNVKLHENYTKSVFLLQFMSVVNKPLGPSV